MAEGFAEEQAYLKQHYLTVYFEDCVRNLLDSRRRSSSSTTTKVDVNGHLRDYFAQVKRELHVVGREFAFVNSTPYNRRALLTHLWSKYETAIPTPGTLKELHTLILTICPDFPYSLLETSATLLENPDWSLSVDYIPYLRAFQLKFVYSEFILESQQLFRSLAHHVTCHVPTAETSVPQENHDHRQLLSEGFEKLIATNVCSSPPIRVLDEVLLIIEKQQQLNHQKFLVQLAKSEKLTRFIGKEPVIVKPPRLTPPQRPTMEPTTPPPQNETRLTLTSLPASMTRISSPNTSSNMLPPLPRQQLLVRERPIRQSSAVSSAAHNNASKRLDSATSFMARSNSGKSSVPVAPVVKQDLSDTETDVESVSSGTDT